MGLRAPGHESKGESPGGDARKLVVADACVLINLAKVGHFGLLSEYFRVMIPSTVYDEVVVRGAGRTGSAEVTTALADHLAFWVIPTPAPEDCRAVPQGLGDGEKCALWVCIQQGLPLLSDDDDAVAVAEELGIDVFTTPDILVVARKQGKIGSLRAVFDALRQQRWRIRPEFERKCLMEAGELD